MWQRQGAAGRQRGGRGRLSVVRQSAQQKLWQSAAARDSVDVPRKSRFDEDREQLLCDLKRAIAERCNDLIGKAAKGTKEEVLKEVERASKQLARARERRRETAELAAETVRAAGRRLARTRSRR